MNGYDLSRQWFDFAFENTDLVSGNHAGVYLWAVELNNRLGWSPKFGLPSEVAMQAVGIKSYKTYSAIFEDLVSWGFFKIHQRSKNQYTANVIGLVIFTEAHTKAHTKALDKAIPKQGEKQYQSISTIIKPLNKETNKPINIDFDDFWNSYDNKKGDKAKAKDKWNALTDEERSEIIRVIPLYKKTLRPEDGKEFQLHPATFLNQRRWENEFDTPGVKQTVDENLPPEVALERERRKSNYDTRIPGMIGMAGKPIEFPANLSVYHLKIGFYNELKK